MTDRLTLAKAFEDAGLERERAEHVAGVVFDAIRENTATKADIRDAVRDLQIEIREQEQRLKTDIREVEQRLRGEMHDAIHQLTMRGLFGAVSLFFSLLAALHYWPPH